MALLDIEDLSVAFGSTERPFYAVDHLSLSVNQGEVLGVVGESGSGKSVSMLALMNLIDAPGRVQAARMAFDGHDLRTMSDRARRRILGADISMIFQDPMASLNPSYTVGFQLVETLAAHDIVPPKARVERAIDLMRQVEIPDPQARLNAYPHQLSGGMSQRVMIAMALAGDPKLLIADEPTTALDVTIQAQILDLLVGLQKQRGMALILITHDLAVVSEVADRVAVMYAGQLVETQPVPDIFQWPRHPYTQALLRSSPEMARRGERLATIPGMVPGKDDRPTGCLFAPRCNYADSACDAARPAIQWIDGAGVRCIRPLNQPTAEAI